MSHNTLNRFFPYKCLTHADKLEQISRGLVPMPVEWHIYPSNVCNHACPWCLFSQNSERDDRAIMPYALLMRAVRDAALHGAKLVHFSGGGEPLLNTGTKDACALAKRCGISVALSTNGTLLGEDVVQNVDFLRVSVNAGNREGYAKANGRDDWDTVVSVLKMCAVHSSGDVGLGFVVTPDNWMQIVPFCEMAADVQADFVHIRPAFMYDPAADTALRDIMPAALSECERATELYSDDIQVYAITNRFDNYWSPRTYSVCRSTPLAAVMKASGAFCVCQDRPDLTFGHDYVQGASFLDVWNSEEHMNVIASLHADAEMGKCPRCVWNKRNEVIEYAYVRGDVRLDLM